MGPMRDLHGGRVGISIHCDDFDTETLGFDGDFFA
jgi:hypothetical protein